MPASTASEEAVATLHTGVDLCYQTFGDPAEPALLLVMGLGGPMTWWPDELCELFAARGFHTIRFDNRDAGRSTQFPQHRVTRVRIVRAFAGHRETPPYTLSEMAADAVALLDHLGIDRAHVAGMSMGGMIAQTLAIEHPERVLSLVSIMSTTGGRLVGWQSPRLLPNILRRAHMSREEYVAASVMMSRMIGSPAYPLDHEEAVRRAGVTYDRGVNPAGVLRQMLAIVTQPDRRRALGGLTMPVTVLHGLSDRMVHSSGGRATARAVPGSELVLVPGMGHDLPAELYQTFADVVARTAARSARAPAPAAR